MSHITWQPTGESFSAKCVPLKTSQGNFPIPGKKKKKKKLSSVMTISVYKQGKVIFFMYCDHKSLFFFFLPLKKQGKMLPSSVCKKHSTLCWRKEEHSSGSLPSASSLHPSLFLPPLIFTDYCWLGGLIRDANEERRP